MLCFGFLISERKIKVYLQLFRQQVRIDLHVVFVVYQFYLDVFSFSRHDQLAWSTFLSVKNLLWSGKFFITPFQKTSEAWLWSCINLGVNALKHTCSHMRLYCMVQRTENQHLVYFWNLSRRKTNESPNSTHQNKWYIWSYVAERSGLWGPPTCTAPCCPQATKGRTPQI